MNYVVSKTISLSQVKKVYTPEGSVLIHPSHGIKIKIILNIAFILCYNS